MRIYVYLCETPLDQSIQLFALIFVYYLFVCMCVRVYVHVCMCSFVCDYHIVHADAVDFRIGYARV
jgi:hypothetical protein